MCYRIVANFFNVLDLGRSKSGLFEWNFVLWYQSKEYKKYKKPAYQFNLSITFENIHFNGIEYLLYKRDKLTQYVPESEDAFDLL